MKEDGYAYFPEVLNEQEIADLRQAMDELTALEESYDRHTDPAEHGFLNKSINNAFNRDPIFVQYLDRPEIIDLVEAVHGDDCHCIGMTAWMTGPARPGSNPARRLAAADPAGRSHGPPSGRDSDFYHHRPLLSRRFDCGAGADSLRAGSHRAGRRPRAGETSFKGVEEQSIMCEAGDCVLFRCEVWHRGTANTSNQMRYLLQVHYAQRIITQKYPPYLNKFQFDAALLAQLRHGSGGFWATTCRAITTRSYLIHPITVPPNG